MNYAVIVTVMLAGSACIQRTDVNAVVSVNNAASMMGYDEYCEYQTDIPNLSLQSYRERSKREGWSISEWPDPDCLTSYFIRSHPEGLGEAYKQYISILKQVQTAVSCQSIVTDESFNEIDSHFGSGANDVPEFAQLKGRVFELCGRNQDALKYYRWGAELGLSASFQSETSLQSRMMSEQR